MHNLHILTQVHTSKIFAYSFCYNKDDFMPPVSVEWWRSSSTLSSLNGLPGTLITDTSRQNKLIIETIIKLIYKLQYLKLSLHAFCNSFSNTQCCTEY